MRLFSLQFIKQIKFRCYWVTSWSMFLPCLSPWKQVTLLRVDFDHFWTYFLGIAGSLEKITQNQRNRPRQEGHNHWISFNDVLSVFTVASELLPCFLVNLSLFLISLVVRSQLFPHETADTFAEHILLRAEDCPRADVHHVGHLAGCEPRGRSGDHRRQGVLVPNHGRQHAAGDAVHFWIREMF